MITKMIGILGKDFVLIGNEVTDHHTMPELQESPIYELKDSKSVISIYAEEKLRLEFHQYMERIIEGQMKERKAPLVLEDLRLVTQNAISVFANRKDPVHLPVFLAGFDLNRERPALFTFDGYGDWNSVRHVSYGKGIAQGASIVGYIHAYNCTKVDKDGVHQLKTIYPFEKF